MQPTRLHCGLCRRRSAATQPSTQFYPSIALNWRRPKRATPEASGRRLPGRRNPARWSTSTGLCRPRSLDAQVLAKEPIRGVNLTRFLEASKDVEDEVGGDGGR